MYLKNPYYLEAIKEEDIKYKARIKLNDITLENSNIKNIKYDLSINDNPKQQEQIKSVNQFAVKDVSIDVNYGGDKAALDRMIRNLRNNVVT